MWYYYYNIIGSERFAELPKDSSLVAKTGLRTRIQPPKPMGFLIDIVHKCHGSSTYNTALIDTDLYLATSGFQSPLRAATVFHSDFQPYYLK